MSIAAWEPEEISVSTRSPPLPVKPPRPRLPPLNALRAFEAAARLGSFVKAADELGVTAGASAPEVLVEEVIDAFAARYAVTVEVVQTAEETIAFNLPRELRPAAA